ncbi:MAG: hypothetical protein K2M99_03835, partial [Treponemataceae bacterium]|nr:hypothetical protein [Treponemataceae bacterium]
IMAASGILTKISQDDVNWLRQTNRDLWERDQLSIKGYVEELTQELAESQAVIEEKDAVIEEKDTALAEKDAQLLAQMREIESLRAKLENKKAAV